MPLPKWVSIQGLIEHALLGLVITALVLLVPPPLNALAVLLVMGTLHEYDQKSPEGKPFSDFIDPLRGGFLNGAADVASFLAPGLIGAVLYWLTH